MSDVPDENEHETDVDENGDDGDEDAGSNCGPDA